MTKKVTDTIEMMTQEVAALRKNGRFVECLEILKRYELMEAVPAVRWLALLNHARCSQDMGNLDAAEQAINAIDRTKTSDEEDIYIDKQLISILEQKKDFGKATELLIKNLAKPEIRLLENEETYCEMLGLMGRIHTWSGNYIAALEFFQQIQPEKLGVSLAENFEIYKAVCLRMLCRYSDAEESLKKMLELGSGDMVVDACFELGLVYWSWGRRSDAKMMLEHAKDNIPQGTKTLQEIDDVLLRLDDSEPFQANQPNRC